MMLLLDQGLPRTLVKLLKASEIDAEHVGVINQKVTEGQV